MSDPAPRPAAAGDAPPRRRRRFVRWLVVLLLVLIVLRVALGLLLPWILDRVARAHGLRVEVESIDLGLLAGDVRVRDLAVLPIEEGSAAVLRVEYADVDVAVLRLLVGEPRVRRLEIDGAVLRLARTADGKWAPFDRLASSDERPEEEPDEGTAPDEGPFDLSIPVRIDALRAQHVRVHLEDALASPPFVGEAELTLRVSDIGDPDREGTLGLTVDMSRVLAVLHVRGTVDASPEHLRASLGARMHGLDLRPVAAYLEPFGVDPRAESIDFALDATLDARATGEKRERLETGFALSGVRLAADGAEAVGLDRLEVRAARTRGGALSIDEVRVEGPRARAARTEDGALAVAGLLVRDAAPGPEGAGADATAEGADATAGAAPSPRLGTIALEGGRIEWRDESVRPPVELALRVEEVLADASRVGAGDGTIELSARLAAERLFDSLTLAGTAAPFAEKKTFRVDVAAAGLAPDALAGMLAAAGIESELEDGALSLAAAGEVAPTDAGPPRVSARIDDLRVRDGDRELLRIGAVGVRDLIVAPERIEVADVEVGGVALDAVKEEGGAVRALGFRFGGAGAGGARSDDLAPAAEEASPPEAAGSPPAVVIDRLRLGADELTLRVEGDEERELRVASTTLDVEEFEFGVPDGGPSRIRFRVVVPRFAEEFVVAGTAGPRDEAFAVALDLRGTGLTGRAAAPFLAGAEPVLSDGVLEARVEADVRFSEDGTTANARLSGVSLRDAGETLLALEEAAVVEATIGSGRVDVREVRAEGLTTRAARAGDGSLTALGFRFPGGGGGRDAPEPSSGAPSAGPERDDGPSGTARTGTSVRVGAVRLRRIEAGFDDDAVSPPVRSTVRLEASLEELSLGPDGGIPSFEAAVEVVETGATVRLDGDVVRTPERTEARVTIAGDGLAIGPLAAYLPPSTASTFDGGLLRARVEAADAAAPAGGRSLSVEVADVELRARADGAPELGWESLSFRAPRLDPDARVFDVEHLVWKGIHGEARVDADGALRVAGLRFAPTQAGDAPSAEAPSSEVSVPPAAPPSRSPLPRLSIGAIEIGAERLAFRDERAARPTPLVLEGFSLESRGGVSVDPEDPVASPPLELSLRGGMPPLVSALAAELTLSPFALEPALEAALDVEGIDGAALESVLPALAETVDASEIGRGTFAARLAASVSARRRGPLDFSFANGFGAELRVEGVSLRDEARPPEEAELFGFDELRVDVARVAPSGDVHVRAIELVRPRGGVARTSDGLVVAGVTLPAPPPEEVVEPDATLSEAVAEAEEAVAAGGDAPSGPATRLDSLVVTDGAFRIEDRAVDPPLRLPLRDVELEVREFSTRTLTEGVPFGFSLFLRAGEVELPLEGAPRRPALGEAFATGRLALAPAPTGMVKASVSALELSNLRGEVAGGGVTLTDGLLDLGTELRFGEDGALDTRTRVTLTDLSVSEPPDGPISRWLKLPAPLDAVVFVLRDSSGAIRIPLDFTLGPDGVSLTNIASTAVGTLTRLVGTAVAQSPLRVGASAGRLVGFGGGEEEAAPASSDPVTFPVASAFPDREGREAIADVAARLAAEPTLSVVLSHDLGTGDRERVAERSNPSRDDALALAARLRDHKRAILDARTDRKSEARAAFATGRGDAAREARERLRALDRELVATEAALDRILDIVRRDEPRYAERRTRDGCVELARLRLEEVRRLLVEAGAPDDESRVRVRSPRYADPERDGAGEVRIDAIERIGAE
ncbi:MAG: DUF748 domain-containing protein [Planctomycetota bacterium JB042]